MIRFALIHSDKSPTFTADPAIQSGDAPPQGFRQLDLRIAYRALIESFLRSDDVPLPGEKQDQSDEKVYDNS